MVKIVRVFLALFATLWYTTSPINSNAPSQIWKPEEIERILNQKVANVSLKYYYQTPEPQNRYSLKDVDCLAKNI